MCFLSWSSSRSDVFYSYSRVFRMKIQFYSASDLLDSHHSLIPHLFSYFSLVFFSSLVCLVIFLPLSFVGLSLSCLPSCPSCLSSFRSSRSSFQWFSSFQVHSVVVFLFSLALPWPFLLAFHIRRWSSFCLLFLSSVCLTMMLSLLWPPLDSMNAKLRDAFLWYNIQWLLKNDSTLVSLSFPSFHSLESRVQ